MKVKYIILFSGIIFYWIQRWIWNKRIWKVGLFRL